MKKDVVAGLGEIGLPILKLLSKQNNVVGYDIDKKLMNNVKFTKFQDTQTSFLHIAIPVTQKFITNVITLFKKFSPECIVIHSTISPGTTEYLQKKMSIPIIYSATRGVHKNMLRDLKRYTKFFVISSNAPKKQWATSTYSKKMKRVVKSTSVFYEEIPVLVTVEKLNPYGIITVREVILRTKGEEITAVRFTVTEDGWVTNINELPYQIIENPYYDSSHNAQENNMGVTSVSYTHLTLPTNREV